MIYLILMWLFNSVFIVGGLLLIVFMGRSVPHHMCAGCRFDLRGSLSGICPECGRNVLDRGWTVRRCILLFVGVALVYFVLVFDLAMAWVYLLQLELASTS